ncbi:hypothetical protein BN1080_02952 [Planococcus massiliensis]|uniref:Uncharacterized protein n=1 Tax=Planococcus massiliensis TaxID=1499687 RepID=A0A098ENS7_9BACL|nr:hypothetical protein [Planococcus massiliensis]CEG23944.1 hypothetical protein BN1080_02952 [Planococcus massiliensis]
MSEKYLLDVNDPRNYFVLLENRLFPSIAKDPNALVEGAEQQMAKSAGPLAIYERVGVLTADIDYTIPSSFHPASETRYQNFLFRYTDNSVAFIESEETLSYPTTEALFAAGNDLLKQKKAASPKEDFMVLSAKLLATYPWQ